MAAKKNTTTKTTDKVRKEQNSKKIKTEPKQLKRSEADKIVAGVAGGIGKYFGVDPTVIRLIFVLLTVFGGGGVLLYIVLWLIMPSEYSTSSNTEETLEENKQEIKTRAEGAAESIKNYSENSGNSRNTLAIILVVLGIFFLLSNLGFFRFIDFSKFWPLLLIFIGIAILMKNE